MDKSAIEVSGGLVLLERCLQDWHLAHVKTVKIVDNHVAGREFAVGYRKKDGTRRLLLDIMASLPTIAMESRAFLGPHLQGLCGGGN